MIVKVKESKTKLVVLGIITSIYCRFRDDVGYAGLREEVRRRRFEDYIGYGDFVPFLFFFFFSF